MATASFVTKFDEGDHVYYYDRVTDVVKRYTVMRTSATGAGDVWVVSYELASRLKTAELERITLRESDLSASPIFPPR